MPYGRAGRGLWSALRDFWNGEHGFPVDDHVRADAGLPALARPFAWRPTSPFVGAWLR